MNEKKSLNFDFLDTDTKDVQQKTTDSSTSEAPKRTPVQKNENDTISFSEYFKDYYSDFTKFCEKHLTKAHPKYFLLVGWIVGMGSIIDRLTSTMQDSSSWGEVWAIVIFGGILAGAIAYWIQGWFYEVRIRWSKGKIDSNTARHIWLFSGLPVAIVSILSLLFNEIAYGDNYFNYSVDGTTVDIIFWLLLLVSIVYSITISYKAIRKISNAEKGRSIWWFIVAPVLVYLIFILASVLAV